MNNRSGSKSTLFLMEQLIVILIFSVCAAVCVKIFVVSYIMVSDASDANTALRMAQNGAECYKAVAGNAESAAAILEGNVTADGVCVYYDKQWRNCGESEAAYVLKLEEELNIKIEETQEVPESLIFGNITVEKISGEELVSLTVAAGRNAR